MADQFHTSNAHPEPEDDWRVPSGYPRCRRNHCRERPVADMRRDRWSRRWRCRVDAWWAYCAPHLREFNREVRDGRVWWLGTVVVNGAVRSVYEIEVRADG